MLPVSTSRQSWWRRESIVWTGIELVLSALKSRVHRIELYLRVYAREATSLVQRRHMALVDQDQRR